MKSEQKRVRAKPGDILEVKTRKGLHYLYYLGKHPEYGDAILIAPGSYSERPTEMNQLFEGGYIKFYPVGLALYHGLVKVVEHILMPDKVVPTRMRRAGMRSGRQILTWVIEDETGDTGKKELSDEERQLPIASIWNHEFLLQRLEEGWRPESEGAPPQSKDWRPQSEDWQPESEDSPTIGGTIMDPDQVALQELFRASTPGVPHVLVHYIYLPSKKAAAKVASELRERGFQAEDQISAEGNDWLVLARHEVVPTEQLLADTRQLMEQLSEISGGEYDGWEAEVRESGVKSQNQNY